MRKIFYARVAIQEERRGTGVEAWRIAMRVAEAGAGAGAAGASNNNQTGL